MAVKTGFFMSLEAAASLLLLFCAASMLALYHFPQQQASDYYLCSDAAIVLSKISAGGLRQSLDELSNASGLCMQAQLNGTSFSSGSGCSTHATQRFSLSFPVWEGDEAEMLSLSCQRQ